MITKLPEKLVQNEYPFKKKIFFKTELKNYSELSNQ